MLVMGLTVYGFQGDKKAVKEIEIYRQQMNKWTQQLQSKEEEYLDVSMRIKEEKQPMGKFDPGQLRIVYKTEGPDKTRNGYEEDKVSFNKDFLFGLQA